MLPPIARRLLGAIVMLATLTVSTSVRGGSAVPAHEAALEREQEAALAADGSLAQARRRYMAAIGITDPDRSDIGRALEPTVAHVLPENVTRSLLARAWRPRSGEGAGFDSPAERLRVMVELARRLGHGSDVGMLQAYFGTPAEAGVAASHAELRAARGLLERDPSHPDLRAEVARLESGLEREIRAILPEGAPAGRWLGADLDVDGNGRVDPGDLAALDAPAPADGSARTKTRLDPGRPMLAAVEVWP